MAFLIALSAGGWFSAQAADGPVDPALREQSVEVIRQVLRQESRWVKVHAAEYLLALDYRDDVKNAFLGELDRHGDEPQYRIGIWRVLARAADTGPERAKWVDKIRNVSFDPDAPDRLHAVETLAKLGYRLQNDELPPMEEATLPENAPLAPYAAWVLLNSGRPGAEAMLTALLDSPEADVRLGAAYALRNQGSLSATAMEKLLAAAGRESATSKARAFLAAAAAVHAPPADRASWKAELLDTLAKGDREERAEAGRALARIGDESDLAALAQLLADPDPDVRAMAADAILRIGRRAPHHLVLLDWIVIAVYALGLLSVGWYYSRRTKTREQFLLGDRKMRPTMVGLSLFAALISTITYLAIPGEIIKHGPMILGEALAYPLVALVVGFWVIPFIMRLRVTSAYEILELRLGPTVRTLGSLLFLTLRLLWMAVIVYATTSKVLIPLLGLDPSVAPLLCTAMTLVAIAYTAMGGLRAAVLTDVIQTAILFGAAIVTVVVVSIKLGGVQAWWPGQWPVHWPEPQFGYDPTARITMFGAALAAFTWYVCTSTSDQIAVQRYLSTRDAKAARGVLFISLGANLVVVAILAAVGLGLLAYFQAFPHLLPDTQNVLGDSDKLFSQFIVIGLPPGFSGLVVAGLLACAMSSLAAGINATCSVVSVDVIDRLRRKTATSDAGQIGQLRHISIMIGVAVVLLSLLVNMVEGNLLEIAYKVVNLLTAPLAGLFFLAMFVPWARGAGAVVGLVCGLATVIAISYWKEITGTPGISFLWAMPLGLLAEVGVGALVSLLPIGGKPVPPEILHDAGPRE